MPLLLLSFTLILHKSYFRSVFFRVIQPLVNQSALVFQFCTETRGARCFSAWEIPVSRWCECDLRSLVLLRKDFFLRPLRKRALYLYTALQFSQNDYLMYCLTFCSHHLRELLFLFYTWENWRSKRIGDMLNHWTEKWQHWVSNWVFSLHVQYFLYRPLLDEPPMLVKECYIKFFFSGQLLYTMYKLNYIRK